MSFWLPGTYGSLASVPAVPGWSFSTFNYYHFGQRLEGRRFCARRRHCGRSHSRIDFLFVNPAYVFATRVLGGQASVGMGALIDPTRHRLSEP